MSSFLFDRKGALAEVPQWFRRLFPYTKWGAELNARITPAFFTWLVGPMKTEAVDIGGQTQMSGVHIEKCRFGYLSPIFLFCHTGQYSVLSMCLCASRPLLSVITPFECRHSSNAKGVISVINVPSHSKSEVNGTTQM